MISDNKHNQIFKAFAAKGINTDNIDPKLLKEPIVQLQASELVASRFLKFCYICGHPILFKGSKTRYEYLEPQKLHECKETKAERLAELNRRSTDI